MGLRRRNALSCILFNVALEKAVGDPDIEAEENDITKQSRYLQMQTTLF
jgi:hypothetical protein